MTTTPRMGLQRSLPGWRLAMWGSVAALLILPLIAMHFTREVAWTGSDFVAAAVLLGGAAALFEVAVRVLPSWRRCAVAGAGIAMALVLTWLQGAVGLI